MSERNLPLEIASLIGEPISTALPVPFEISAIADTFTAEAGEHVWRYQWLDETVDMILEVTDSTITPIRRKPVGDVEITFHGYNSKLEYVYVEDVLERPDVQVLARRKEAITRGMDKKEVKLILDAIMTSPQSATYLPLDAEGGSVHATFSEACITADDLYDLVMRMKHKIENYGDKFVLLVGSNVKEAIDTFDKDNAATFNYRIGLFQVLKDLGIEVIKVFGKVATDVSGAVGGVALLDADAMILVAKNSRIAEGKPVKFVRRKISADIAKLMGADVDNAQRAIIANPVPVTVGSDLKLAYGVYGYESCIFLIANPLAICVCHDASLAL